VFVFASVCVWIVMRFDRSRRIHFRRKLSFQYLKGSPVCKAEKAISRLDAGNVHRLSSSTLFLFRLSSWKRGEDRGEGFALVASVASIRILPLSLANGEATRFA
jgi:hypothetical protein